MFTINKYVMAESLNQAYELNQSKRNAIIGGMLWLKMGRKKIDTAIDLTSLSLNLIEEDDSCFKIGCMCTLRDIEINSSLDIYFKGFIKKSVEHIVGVQMRNMATVGGSIFSRFGFSDILTAFMALNSYVELYKGGIIPLKDFVNMPHDNDILIKIIIKKDGCEARYLSHRISSTDLPVLTCAVSNTGDKWNIVVGARPMKAKLFQISTTQKPNKDEIDTMIFRAVNGLSYGSNLRGSKKYREILTDVLIRRNIDEILNGGKYGN